MPQVSGGIKSFIPSHSSQYMLFTLGHNVWKMVLVHENSSDLVAAQSPVSPEVFFFSGLNCKFKFKVFKIMFTSVLLTTQ